ncbi:MAG TPA: cytochrome c oxidase subunit 3 [Candidatus Thalassarchaeaceae archaeon]|nr:cytochrome c oxidase subunit 3 [Candidatus Thalassarchaeaceae archaeon]HJM67275.1 cytochrome c oxidase subunit 3 [Candidatus Thalassarchaeaceae archaeon]
MSYGEHDDHHDHHQHSHWGPHDWTHGHGGAPHNSWAPLMMAFGASFFLLGFTKVFTQTWDDGADIWTYAIHSSQIGILIAGLAIFFAGITVFWRQDWSHDGSYEAKSEGTPFRTIDIRKVALWMFLMSEMMVFSSLFSTYLRYRTGFDNCETLFASGVFTEGQSCWLPASYFIAEGGYHQEHAHAALGFMPDTLIPGAINTFALIISSYTIVLALKTAKDASLSDAERNSKVGKYLLTTLGLATLFLIFKMVEWFIGFEIGHGEDALFHSPSLLADGFTIHASEYTYCHEWDHHGGADHAGACAAGSSAIFDIRMAASTFYVTTGTHGVHVLGGMVALFYMVIKAFRGGYTPQNAVSIEYFGLYWHFVDLVWVLVFPAFYLY